MLKLSEIKKDYKVASGAVHALKGVSLEFRKSEFVCILGQSGCGKTTLLNIIGGLDHYTSGDLIIQGKSTKDFSDRDWDVYRNHRIGFVFQTYNLIPHQTVLANVELALTIAGLSKAERKEKARRALERVGLGEELSKRPNQLSGGQMQRVAIARAIVNDPDILLADEPTGALDSKTSVQIMDLIKEIAAERLVIMVTHNPELAESYATRIVRLHDGIVESDSDPYTATDEEHAAARFTEREGVDEGANHLEEAESAQESADSAPQKGQKGKKEKKHRARMGLFAAVSLSFRSLLTRKGRTTATSIAGSIGIISVCLVLALSNGFGNYMRHTEEDMLSAYPISVSETTLDYSAAMEGITSPSEMPDLSELEAGNKLYINSFLTNLAQGVAIVNTITPEYIEYLEDGVKNHPDWFSAVQYNYGFEMTNALFTKMTVGGKTANKDVTERISSVEEIKDYLIQELIHSDGGSPYQSLLGFVNLFTDVFNKMPGTSDFTSEDYGKYVRSQYDVIYGNFPTNEHEAVLVVGPNNDVIDLTLVQLGFLTEEQFLTLFNIGLANDEETAAAQIASMRTEISLSDEESDEEATRLSYDSVLAQQYVLYYPEELFTDTPGYSDMMNMLGRYRYTYHPLRDALDFDEEGTKGIDFKISGILRLKEGLSYGCLEEGLNLPEATVDKYVAHSKDSEIAKYAAESTVSRDIIVAMADYIEENRETLESRMPFNIYYNEEDENDYTRLYYCPAEHFSENYLPLDLTSVGYPGVTMHVALSPAETISALGADDSPSAISIYPTNFDTKDNVMSYLDAWNETHADSEQIKYTDRVGLLMGMIQTVFDLITYVLVAFTAISLVVSSVMIGIITYVSVVERIKEIGVLRSLGARKQDIRNLFNAETFIIGLASGLFGVLVSYILSAVISAIIEMLSGIAGLASLAPLTALIMVCVSVVLTLISGLIPAQAAAKKDPVIALRTE